MYDPKHVEQFPDKIKCVKLHLVGYILEYICDERTHKLKVNMGLRAINYRQCTRPGPGKGRMEGCLIVLLKLQVVQNGRYLFSSLGFGQYYPLKKEPCSMNLEKSKQF